MPVAGAAIMTTRKSVSSNGTDCDLPNVFMAYTIPSIESLGHAHRVVRPCPQAHAPIPLILPLVHRGSESWPKSSGFAERETARQWHCHANGTPELSPYRDSDIPFETKNVSSGRLASSAKCTPIRYGSVVGRRSTMKPVHSANGRNFTASHRS